jgi:hypothetical protein
VNTLPPEVAMLVEAAGGVPRQYDSEMNWRRWHHADLVDMNDEQVEAERILVGVAWAALVRSLWIRADDPTLACSPSAGRPSPPPSSAAAGRRGRDLDWRRPLRARARATR